MYFVREVYNDENIIIQNTDDGHVDSYSYLSVPEGVFGRLSETEFTVCRSMLDRDKALSAKVSFVTGCSVECRSGFIHSVSAESNIFINMRKLGLRGICKGASASTNWRNVYLEVDDSNAMEVVSSVVSHGVTAVIDVSGVEDLKLCERLYSLYDKYISGLILDTDAGRGAYCALTTGRQVLHAGMIYFTYEWDERYVRKYGADIINCLESFDFEQYRGTSFEAAIQEWRDGIKSVRPTFSSLDFYNLSYCLQNPDVLNTPCSYVSLGGSCRRITNSVDKFLRRAYEWR